MLTALVALQLAAPPLLVRVDAPAALAGLRVESLGGPFYRVRGGRAAELLKRRGVRWAVGEARRRLVLDQTADPFEPLQWHLFNDGSRTDLWPRIVVGAHVNARAAWLSHGEGSASVVIAVLDAGIPATHPDLPAAARVPGWDFVDHDDDPSPVGSLALAAHGTAVAGIVAGARNGSGVVGVCPNCRVMSVRLLAPDETTRDGDIVAALTWAAERADVINASWSFDPHAYVSPAVIDAIRWAESQGRGGKGAVVVFSAGNRGSAIPAYTPQAMVETLTVGATDEEDAITSYSSYGAGLDLVAPGGVGDELQAGDRIARAKIITADLEGSAGSSPTLDAIVAPGISDDAAVTAAFTGTSASAPIVAGGAGLLLSLAPDLRAAEVRWLLSESAAKIGPLPYDAGGRNDRFGYGRLDLGAALALAQSGAYCVAADEVCDNGADDDCDRTVDADDPDCGALVPRPFTVPLGLACIDNTVCGDGYCSRADGTAAVRLCTTGCDFDCPDGGACVGPDGDGACALLCTDNTNCPSGTSCGTPDAAFLPPSQTAQSVCLPSCATDADCLTAACAHHTCSAPRKEPLPPADPPGEQPGCGCGSATPTWAICVALVVLRGRRRRQPASS